MEVGGREVLSSPSLNSRRRVKAIDKEEKEWKEKKWEKK
jgi:hypothetical protein